MGLGALLGAFGWAIGFMRGSKSDTFISFFFGYSFSLSAQ